MLDNPVGWKLLRGGLFIHLYREDLLGQAISLHFARATGRWGIDDTVVTPPVTTLDFFDTSALDRTVEEMARDDLEWRIILARSGTAAVSVSYERFCQDPFGFVIELARRLGIDPGLLRHGYSEAREPERRDPALPNKGEIARNYLSAMQKMQGAPAIRRAVGRFLPETSSFRHDPGGVWSQSGD